MNVPGQAIQRGDQQRALLPLAVLDRRRQRPIFVALAGFHLRKLGGQFAGLIRGEVPADRIPLGFQPQAGITLLISRNPEISDEFSHLYSLQSRISC
jgi:hypothetical protein